MGEHDVFFFNPRTDLPFHVQYPLIATRARLTDAPDGPYVPLPAWIPQDWENKTYPAVDPKTDYAASCKAWLKYHKECIDSAVTLFAKFPLGHPQCYYTSEPDFGPSIRDAYRLARYLKKAMTWPGAPREPDRPFKGKNLGAAVGEFDKLLTWLDGCLMAHVTKTPKKRGRAPDTDAESDRRLWELWKSGRFKDYADLAAQEGIGKLAVKQAVDRHRKRIRGPTQRRKKSR